MGQKPGPWIIACGVIGVFALAARAQVSFTGGTYSQNFDGITNTTAGQFNSAAANSIYALHQAPMSASSLTGWSAWHGDFGQGTMNYAYVDGTTSVTGLLGSVGIAGVNLVTDRALVSQATTVDANPAFGVTLQNNTGLTYTTLSIDFFVECWRRNDQSNDTGNTSNPFVQGNNFSYRIGNPGTSITTSGFTAVPQLQWKRVRADAPFDTALDGNDPGNRSQRSVTDFPIGSWAPSQYLILKWSDTADSGVDDFLAIDDLNITPAPEPAGLGLLGLGGMVALLQRRRR